MGRSEDTRPSAGAVLGAIGAVLGLTALIVSLTGIAGATPRHTNPTRIVVRQGDIAPGAVTATALAKGAVTSKKLANESVNRRVLKQASVTARSLAADAVSATAIAPGSVYGGALGGETIHATPIADLDKVARNAEWTTGNTEEAICAAGERLLSAGFAFTEVGNGEVSFVQDLPFVSATANGVSGAFSSDSGGGAKGEVVALCLK